MIKINIAVSKDDDVEPFFVEAFIYENQILGSINEFIDIFTYRLCKHFVRMDMFDKTFVLYFYLTNKYEAPFEPCEDTRYGLCVPKFLSELEPQVKKTISQIVDIVCKEYGDKIETNN